MRVEVAPNGDVTDATVSNIVGISLLLAKCVREGAENLVLKDTGRARTFEVALDFDLRGRR